MDYTRSYRTSIIYMFKSSTFHPKYVLLHNMILQNHNEFTKIWRSSSNVYKKPQSLDILTYFCVYTYAHIVVVQILKHHLLVITYSYTTAMGMLNMDTYEFGFCQKSNLQLKLESTTTPPSFFEWWNLAQLASEAAGVVIYVPVAVAFCYVCHFLRAVMHSMRTLMHIWWHQSLVRTLPHFQNLVAFLLLHVMPSHSSFSCIYAKLLVWNKLPMSSIAGNRTCSNIVLNEAVNHILLISSTIFML